jgi:hypothetical protein
LYAARENREIGDELDRSSKHLSVVALADLDDASQSHLGQRRDPIERSLQRALRAPPAKHAVVNAVLAAPGVIGPKPPHATHSPAAVAPPL